jgi:Na+-translocating ferredoxin:NAD+ oxidoreductase RnfA subunit
VVRERLRLVAVYVTAALGLWIAARWLLIPLRLEQLTAQFYVLLLLAPLAAAGRNHSGGPERLRTLAVLILLGIPLLDHAGRLPLTDYLLPAVAAGLGWLTVGHVVGMLADRLRAEEVPIFTRQRGGRLVIAGLLYWALMGFFNVGFI